MVVISVHANEYASHERTEGYYFQRPLQIQGVVTLIRPVELSATGIKMESSYQEAIQS